jgi:hypothetical protein
MPEPLFTQKVSLPGPKTSFAPVATEIVTKLPELSRLTSVQTMEVAMSLGLDQPKYVPGAATGEVIAMLLLAIFREKYNCR